MAAQQLAALRAQVMHVAEEEATAIDHDPAVAAALAAAEAAAKKLEEARAAVVAMRERAVAVAAAGGGSTEGAAAHVQQLVEENADLRLRLRSKDSLEEEVKKLSAENTALRGALAAVQRAIAPVRGSRRPPPPPLPLPDAGPLPPPPPACHLLIANFIL